MRLAELLRCDVVDVDGAPAGRVHDVRLVQDGRYVEGFGNLLRVDGLVIGDGALAERLGLHRTSVHGPWPLTLVLRRIERAARYARWDQVARVEAGTISLSVRADELVGLRSVE